MTFDSPVEVASYDWMTANDAPARDPSKWTLEGSNDGSSWTVVEDSNADSPFDVTTERYMYQGPFCVGAEGSSGGLGSSTTIHVSDEFAQSLHDSATVFDDCFLTPEEIATSDAAAAFVQVFRETTAASLGVSPEDIDLNGISTDGDTEPGC